MSYEEKNTWAYLVIAVVVPVVYIAEVLRRLQGTEVTQVGYVRPMLAAIGVAIALNIAASMVAAMASPKDAGQKDVRDQQINRRGEHVGFYVMSAGAAVPLGLALAEADYFWIANALYLAFVLSALGSSIVKIVAYRRGF